MKGQTLFVCAFAIVVTETCSSSTEPSGINCPDSLIKSILVTVVDSASGAMIGNAVTATAIDGQYFDAVTTPDVPVNALRSIGLVEQRAGKYDVYASKAGYEPWVRRAVVVKQGACGTVQVKVTANLKRQGA